MVSRQMRSAGLGRLFLSLAACNGEVNLRYGCRVYSSSSSYGLFAAGRGLRCRQAGEASGEDWAEVCGDYGPREYLWRGALLRCDEEAQPEADPRVRAVCVQGRGSSREA